MYTLYVTWVAILFLTNTCCIGVFSYLSYAAYSSGWRRGGAVLVTLSGLLIYNLITVMSVIYLLIA